MRYSVNSLSPGKSRCGFEDAIFDLVLLIVIFKCSQHNALRGMPQDLTSALNEVMAWCHRATSHYLNQCWPSSLTHICGPSGRWVKPDIKPPPAPPTPPQIIGDSGSTEYWQVFLHISRDHINQSTHGHLFLHTNIYLRHSHSYPPC